MKTNRTTGQRQDTSKWTRRDRKNQVGRMGHTPKGVRVQRG